MESSIGINGFHGSRWTSMEVDGGFQRKIRSTPSHESFHLLRSTSFHEGFHQLPFTSIEVGRNLLEVDGNFNQLQLEYQIVWKTAAVSVRQQCIRLSHWLEWLHVTQSSYINIHSASCNPAPTTTATAPSFTPDGNFTAAITFTAYRCLLAVRLTSRTHVLVNDEVVLLAHSRKGCGKQKRRPLIILLYPSVPFHIDDGVNVQGIFYAKQKQRRPLRNCLQQSEYSTW